MRAFREVVARRLLTDTSAYVALADAGDAQHAVARSIAARLGSERWNSFTTNFIVAEVHGLVIARRSRDEAARVLREIDESATTIVRVSAGDERRAREIIYQYQEKDFSLTDAISFAVMERLGIGYAFTFDRHLVQYGFALVTP